MEYIDQSIIDLIYLSFTIILIVFLGTVALNIVADFFNKIFHSGLSMIYYDRFKKPKNF
jgi:hypothetical protein